MNFFVTFLFVLSTFLPVQHVIAASEPTYNQAILNIGKPIPPEAVVTPQVGDIAPWNFTIKFQNAVSSVFKDIETKSYQDKHTIYTPNFGPESDMFERAGVRLTNRSIQERFLRLITYTQHMTSNHTQCYYDEANGTEHHPDRNIFKAPAMHLSPLRNGVWMLAAMMSTWSLPMKLYNFFENLVDEKVTAENGLKCGTTTDNVTKMGFYEAGTGEQFYDKESHPQAQWTPPDFCPPGVIQEYLKCLAEQAICSAATKAKSKDNTCDVKNCSLQCSDSAHTVYSTNTTSLSTPDDTTDKIGYLGEKKRGITYTQYPEGFAFNKVHAVTDQSHVNELSVSHSEITGPAPFAYVARVKEHIAAFYCTFTPYSKRDPERPCPSPQAASDYAGIRNEVDAVEDREPAQCSDGGKPLGGGVSKTGLDKAITEAAAKTSLPACLFQGIAFIEGATAEMEKTSCVPNQCGAAGPFQISVGQDSCGSNTCDSCGPSWKGRACNDETAAIKNAMGILGKSGDPKKYACDVGVAAVAAGLIAQGKAKGFNVPFNPALANSPTAQKNSIITAADAYYGVTTPIARLGNLSYGEYVYSKCDPSYTNHVEHTFPYGTPIQSSQL